MMLSKIMEGSSGNEGYLLILKSDRSAHFFQSGYVSILVGRVFLYGALNQYQPAVDSNRDLDSLAVMDIDKSYVSTDLRSFRQSASSNPDRS
jgi:hypothetical protein